MTASLELSDRIFQNAMEFSVCFHPIPNGDVVDALTKETGRWFAKLDDSEADTEALRHRLWRLRAAAQLTLLPFSSADLGLRDECNAIADMARFFPDLLSRSGGLKAMVEALLELPENPKRRLVIELISSIESSTEQVALVTELTRGRVPGWPESLIREFKTLFPKLEIVSSRHLLEQSVYDRIILPSGGRLCPFIADLYECGRSPKLEVVAYRRESLFTHERASLPEGTVRRTSMGRTAEPVRRPEPESEDLSPDRWMQQQFWTSIRGVLSGNGSASGHEYFVKARLVVLANSKKTFLENDSKVIEVSAILNRTIDTKEFGRRMPRRLVNELRPGHMVALRTSRSGHYLIEVADSLLASDGKKELRKSALDWKLLLRNALVQNGTEKLAALLRMNNRFESYHAYIWMWTTDHVISPQSKALFIDLIRILDELGFSLGDGNPEAVAEERWGRMRELIHYHHLAGNRIRKALLHELELVIARETRIEDEIHLTLAGHDAGRMSLYRITDVDPEVVDVPYSYIEVLKDLEA